MHSFAAGIAGVVIEGLSIVAFITIAVLAQKNNRGGFSDPVRRGLNWFKAGLYLIIAYLSLFLISIGLAFISDFRPYVHIRGVALLFWNYGVYALLLSFAYLAVGAHKVDNGQDSKGFINFVRVVMGLEAFLYFASFIFWRWLDVQRGEGRWYRRESDRIAVAAFSIISLIQECFLLIVAITTTVYACLRRNKARRVAAEAGTGLPAMRRVWEKLIPATAITIVTTAWGLTWTVISGTSVVWYYYNDHDAMNILYLSLALVDIIVSKWVLFAACVMIYLLGKKDKDGLWSAPGEEVSREKDAGGHISA